LPIPRLILIDLVDPASADLYGLSQRLAAALPNALLDDHSIWAKRLRTMAGTMVAAGGIVLVLVLTAMVLSVVFATRAAMAGNRDVVEVLHFVGAEDSFVAGEFQQHFLILGLKGGIGGGLSAMISFAGCKRLMFSSAFYPAIQQPNAELVDAPIERATPAGIVVALTSTPSTVRLVAVAISDTVP